MDPRTTMIYLIVREFLEALEALRVIWVIGVNGLWLSGLIVEVLSLILIILTIWLMNRKLNKQLMKVKTDVESKSVLSVCCPYEIVMISVGYITCSEHKSFKILLISVETLLIIIQIHHFLLSNLIHPNYSTTLSIIIKEYSLIQTH